MASRGSGHSKAHPFGGAFRVTVALGIRAICFHGLAISAVAQTTTETTTSATTATVTETSTETETSATTAFTTTTTSAPWEASCSMRRMGCPVPEEYVDANYVILGNESGAGACQAQGTGDNLYFEFGVDECNATVVIDSAGGREVYTVTLVPNIALGGLDFVDWPDMVCSCEVDTMGTVIAAVVEVVDDTAQENIEGRSEFEPAMTMYPNDSFAQPLQDVGGGFSVSSERFFLGISSNSTDDIISVAGCTAAPTAAADDPFTQVVWEAYCPVGPFDADYHEHAPTNELHLSMRAFRFAGLEEVVLTCTIIRCPQEPCGVCDPDARRRLQSGEAVDASESRRLVLKAGPESTALVLPGVVDQSSLSQLFVSTAERQTSSPALESSVTLLNCPVSSEGRFVQALQSALEAWLGMDDVEVAILEVLAAGSRGSLRLRRRRRRLQDDAPADAVVVRFEMVPTSQDDADYALARLQAVLAIKSSEALADAVSTELELALGGQVENLLVEKGPVEQRVADQVAEAEASSDGSGGVDVIFVVVAAGAGLILGACLVCSGCLLWRCVSMKLHANTPPAAAAAAAAAAPADGAAELGPVAEAATAAPAAAEDAEAPSSGGAETELHLAGEVNAVV